MGIKNILSVQKCYMNYQPNYVFFIFKFSEKYSCQQTWANRFPSDFTKLFLEHLKCM